MVNKVVLVGNVGKDPEVQYISEDLPVARFSLATSESYKNKNGERVTNTEWHNIVVWRGLARVVEQYVQKGSLIYIEGKITNRSYEKDGVTRYTTEIVASEMKMLGRKSDSDAGQTQSYPKAQAAPAPVASDFDAPLEDDLPF
jgi:single-strand DNA-binding protein